MSNRSIPKVLTEDEQKSFLNQFNIQYKTPKRDWMMCRLMLKTGLRVSEVCNLKPEHIDLNSGKLIVRDGKGSKDRVVFLVEPFLPDIKEWLEEHDDEYVFTTNTGNKIATSHLRRVVGEKAKQAVIQEAEKVSPHTLRHTFATHFYRKTKDLRALQMILGHSRIETTEIYTHIFNDELKGIMEEACL